MQQRYTARESRGILAKAMHMQVAEGVTLRYAALHCGKVLVIPYILSKWSKRHSDPR
jgi:hypothetical protein